MITIFIIDSHRLFRVALMQLINSSKRYKLVGHSDYANDSIQLIRDLNPDVILIDVHMDEGSIFDIQHRLKEFALRIIAIVSHALHPMILQIIKSNILSCISKRSTDPELFEAIDSVKHGRKFLSQDVSYFIAYCQMKGQEESLFAKLSNREMQIVLMLVHCKKIKEISESLFLSPKTVNSYRYRVFEKLSISSDLELLILALQHELLSFDELAIPIHDKRYA